MDGKKAAYEREQEEELQAAMLDASHIHPVIMDAIKLQKKKGETYNGPNDIDLAKSQYFPYGHESYLTMLHIKLKRIEGIALDKNRPINFESTYDSILDIINYASFYGAYLKQQEKL